jgi:hypothetical protein
MRDCEVKEVGKMGPNRRRFQTCEEKVLDGFSVSATPAFRGKREPLLLESVICGDPSVNEAPNKDGDCGKERRRPDFLKNVVNWACFPNHPPC